jgi:hypothetical protein
MRRFADVTDYEALEAEPFINYRDDWLKGQLSLPELFAIPRKPLFIGRVPNPEEFSSVDFGDYDGAKILKPTIDMINDVLKRTPEQTANLPEWLAPGFVHSANGEPHIDISLAGYKGLYTEISTIFTDAEPTFYFVGAMATAAEDISKLPNHEVEAMTAQPDVICFQGQTYDIYAHDLTIPHAGPSYASSQRRTFGRYG